MSGIKSSIILAACLLVMVGCDRKTPSKDGRSTAMAGGTRPPLILVPAVGMGDVRFGMTKGEVIAHLGKPDGMADSGLTLLYLSKGFTVTVHPQFGVIAFTCSAVAAMPPNGKAKDFQGRTEEGIGIGATEEDIVAAYGDPDTRDAEGGQTDLHYPERGMRFLLLDDRLQQLTLRSRWQGRPVRK